MFAFTPRRMIFWCMFITLLGFYAGYSVYTIRDSATHQETQFEPYRAPHNEPDMQASVVPPPLVIHDSHMASSPTQKTRQGERHTLSPWDLEKSPRHGGIGLAPVWSPRPLEEWQGMRVNLRDAPHCEEIPCGLALACIENRCVACTDDRDCGAGEACVLDHCVLKDHTSCTSKDDCDEGELCVLSGYSTGLRGNEDMIAKCFSSDGGTLQDDSQSEEIDYGITVPRVVSAESLKSQLVEHVKSTNLPLNP